MQDGSAKQHIVERIKKATNILVTVNSNPTVDELSAALGFTLMLNKMDKHATAVFSGAIPPAISFLQPDKTFESNVDSLRDFIIALDKEKADRLRYKVEDDVVRVFITPYRTSISEKDLKFSQGDFNVELIIALGVEKRDDLDKAIVAHGRILHDAETITINSHRADSSLGSIDWSDSNTSSLCEMLMSLSEALQPNLLDEQIATSLLTGIVAATDRFSNTHTTPRVMTMSAQLMAAGANQQLIATKLEHVLQPKPADGSTFMREGASSKVEKPDALPVSQEPVAEPQQSADGEMQVEHTPAPQSEPTDTTPGYDVESALTQKLSSQLPQTVPATDGFNLNQELERETAAVQMPTPMDMPPAPSQQAAYDAMPPQLPQIQPLQAQPVEQVHPEIKLDKSPFIHDSKPSWMSASMDPPAMGSALSATTQQALEDVERERVKSSQQMILSHDGPSEPQPVNQPVVQFPITPDQTPEQSSPFALDFEEAPLPTAQPAPAPAPTLAELEAQAHQQAAQPQNWASDPVEQTAAQSEEEARNAVQDAFNGVDFDPANSPLQSMGATPLPAIDHSTPSTAAFPPESQQAMPPLPDFSTLPPLPPQPLQAETPFADPMTMAPSQAPVAAPVAQPQAPVENNPGQFRIPGQ